ncbi:MAG: efflux RND transporter permease subunit [Myxococcales bacterium]|nr:efflux RND transporter permease subunit [Myxococcales bacterium]
MLDAIVRWSVRRRAAVLVFTALILIAGAFAAKRLPIDAVPDVTNTQVQVLTDAPGLSAEEMERYVTVPVETGLNGIPRLQQVRSVTRGGLSAVTAVFEDGMDLWFARQLVMERLREIEADVPSHIARPSMAPVSTGLGEIYYFVLRSDRHSSMELRTMLDWDIAPKLRRVSGVIEVNSFGGAKKQYEVVVRPSRLAAHGLTLGRVLDALERNNSATGGGYVERGPEQYVIRGDAQLRTVEDIGSVVVATDPHDGTPVLVRHLAEVRIGAALPQGVVTRDGEGEAVTGVVMMLYGQNSRDVILRVHAAMDQVRASLPAGVRVDVVYDRKDFIDRTLGTVAKNLVEGALLVALVILVFLGSIRGSLLVTLGIPFSMAITLFGMHALGVSGNLMSLGAIDFGFLVDGPIVMLEAAIAALTVQAARGPTDAKEAVAEAVRRVARPVVFSVLIILLVYLPLLSLEGVEGKMFRPMALTMGLALGGSVLFALVVFPAGAVAFLKPPAEGSKPHRGLLQRLEGPYRKVVSRAVARPWTVVLLFLASAALVVPAAKALGADFVPRIDEGDLVVGVRRVPSIGISEVRRLDLETERVLRRFPEVRTALALSGRAEVATDPVGIDSTEILCRLRPKSEWTTARDLDGLSEAITRAIHAEIPSTFASVSQPIEDRSNELLSGSRADVAINLYGDDLRQMTETAGQIARVARSVSGAGDVRVERVLGLPLRQVRVDRSRLARYAIDSADVLAAVESLRQGRAVGHIFEGHRRFDLRVLLSSSGGTEAVGNIPIGAANGRLIPLAQLARVEDEDGPSQISREGMRRRLRVEVNLRGRDLVSWVDEARSRVGREVQLPPGYTVEWAGQFENFARAQARLAVVVPAALGIIVMMLFAMFGNARFAMAVFSCVPFALGGGVLALKARGLSFSLPAAVGFIALMGIAVLNGVVMTSEIRRRADEGAAHDEAIVEGAASVLQPLLLTALVAALGFAPMAMSTSAGSEVQRPLATVVIGGLTSSTLLGLVLLPALLRVMALRANRPEGEGAHAYRAS